PQATLLWASSMAFSAGQPALWRDRVSLRLEIRQQSIHEPARNSAVDLRSRRCAAPVTHPLPPVPRPSADRRRHGRLVLVPGGSPHADHPGVVEKPSLTCPQKGTIKGGHDE